jgi:hypothetical protein
MRVLGIIIIILGLVGVVFGILFFPQASSGRNEVADSIAPIPLDHLNATYDAVVVKHDQIRAAEEPNIQAGKAMPSDMYNYLSAQRALLGLAKSNIGTVDFVQFMGIVCICMGVGVAAAGFYVFRKA